MCIRMSKLPFLFILHSRNLQTWTCTWFISSDMGYLAYSILQFFRSSTNGYNGFASAYRAPCMDVTIASPAKEQR